MHAARRGVMRWVALWTCALCLPLSAVHATEPLNVFAAASLRDALDEVANRFEISHGIEVRRIYLGSATAARQIALGAPADVYISAHEAWMDFLQERALIDADSRVTLLGNRLVLIAPSDDASAEALWRDPEALKQRLEDGPLAMGHPRSVPAGQYGAAALRHLGLWEIVKVHVVTTEDVRAALALVTRGEARLGLVYQSDAVAAGFRVRVVGQLPTEAHPIIRYPAARVTRSEHGAAQDFIDFLQADAQITVFTRWGFTEPLE
ncbi:MAG: molybdate ABC transporter substrate-binding protein [Algiphilus sp.]|uniref:molybdate ABC transporter substrate-binding protein n=1 Tax=Algiphilus sp. TaxID=1872431 RepID=UPI0032EB5F39